MKNQRKLSGLVMHRIQREIGALVIVVLMITVLGTAFLIHWTLEEALREAEVTQMSGQTIETLLIFKRLLLDRIFIALTLAIFVIGFVVMKVLHRVTGPLNRIQNALQAVGEGGSPKELVLRERDYFVELAEEVNQVIRRVGTMKGKERKGGK